MTTHSQGSSVELQCRYNEEEKARDDPVVRISISTHTSNQEKTYAASHPNVWSAPCFVAQGTWKYATLKPVVMIGKVSYVEP